MSIFTRAFDIIATVAIGVAVVSLFAPITVSVVACAIVGAVALPVVAGIAVRTR